VERTVLVTGGTVRLGAAIAARLAADGWRVVACSHRADAGADVVADLSRPGGAEALFASAVSLLGGRAPDALVNNAALFAGEPDALESVNFAAPAALAALMAGHGGECVVNVLDCRVLASGFRPATPYEATKARLLARTLEDARRFAGRMRVNAVAPGPVLVPVSVREKAGECPFGRPSPESVADAVAFLLSARATSGCVVPVDGGQLLSRS